LANGSSTRPFDRDRYAPPSIPVAFVDQAAERGQPLAQRRDRRDIPLRVDVAEPLVEQQDVGRPPTDDHAIFRLNHHSVMRAGLVGIRARLGGVAGTYTRED
jgi:hypothetical protein